MEIRTGPKDFIGLGNNRAVSVPDDVLARASDLFQKSIGVLPNLSRADNPLRHVGSIYLWMWYDGVVARRGVDDLPLMAPTSHRM